MLFFGKDYLECYGSLTLNIRPGVFVVQSCIKMTWEISEDFQAYYIVMSCVAILINVKGNAIPICIYGMTGAAMAILLSRAGNNKIRKYYSKLRAKIY